jgi:cytochrome P450
MVHTRKRRILNSVFSEKTIRLAETFVLKHVDRWCELLLGGSGETWSEAKNMAEWSDYLVFDILGDLCFGKSFEIKEPGDNPLRVVPHAIATALKFYYPVGHSSDCWGK